MAAPFVKLSVTKRSISDSAVLISGLLKPFDCTELRFDHLSLFFICRTPQLWRAKGYRYYDGWFPAPRAGTSGRALKGGCSFSEKRQDSRKSYTRGTSPLRWY